MSITGRGGNRLIRSGLFNPRDLPRRGTLPSGLINDLAWRATRSAVSTAARLARAAYRRTPALRAPARSTPRQSRALSTTVPVETTTTRSLPIPRAHTPLMDWYRRRTRPRTQITRQTFYNRQTRGFIGLENKFIDTSVDNRGMVTSVVMQGGELDPTTVNCLNAITQGDGECQRDGRVVHITSIYIDGILEHNKNDDLTTPISPLNAIVALVLDTQTNKAQVQSEDVWVNPGSTSTNSVLPLRNLANSTRIRVLWRKKFSISAPEMTVGSAIGQTDSSSRTRRFQLYKSFKKPIKVNYTGTTGTVAAILDNSFHFIGLSTNSNLLITYNCRIRFKG